MDPNDISKQDEKSDKSAVCPIAALPPLRDTINAHGLQADKNLGQNFLLDQNITDKIARHAGLACGGSERDSYKNLLDKNIVEIGPGPGGLTRSLLKTPLRSLTAVEFDPRAIAALENLKNAVSGRLNIIEADAMKIDVTSLCPAPRLVVANLPYNIATPLLIGWLKQIRDDHYNYEALILMFQKEVAQRITAKENTKAYGRLSVMAQWLCNTKKLFDLSPAAFTPPPKVTSSIVQFIPNPLDDNAPQFETMERITAAAFGQRRKMVRSSLKDYIQYFEACGIEDNSRAENLTVKHYSDLAKAVETANRIDI